MNSSAVDPFSLLRSESEAWDGNEPLPSGIARFFFTWERVLQLLFTAHERKEGATLHTEFPAAIHLFEQRLEAIKAMLLQQFLATGTKEEKERLIHSIQTLIIHLLNKVHAAGHLNKASHTVHQFYTALRFHMAHLLDNLKELYGPYFNRWDQVPDCQIETTTRSLQAAYKSLPLQTDEVPGTAQPIGELLVQQLEIFSCNGGTLLLFHEVWYYEALLKELQALGPKPSAQSLREVLYFLNYNEPAFVEYECQRLWALLKDTDAVKYKIALLRQEQKRINQFPGKLNWAYTPTLPPLREQVGRWIQEEIKYLESGAALVLPEGDESTGADKIHTSLSVAKLAVLIRLLVVDKIIINRSVAPMLRVAARVFSTLQKDDVSFGSLEAKYHAPDKTTINAVRDLLFKWINILGKL